MRIRLLLAIALPCITVACRNPLADLRHRHGSPRQPMGGVWLPLGPLLSDSSERVSRYVLSPDGSEAYYVMTWAGAYTLRAVNRTTGARRTLVTGPCRPNQFAPSASGSHLYVAWSDGCDQYGLEQSPSRLYRISVSSGTVELALDSALAVWPALDGQRLLYVPWCPATCDHQVWIYDPAGPTRRYLGRGDSVVLSPDGREALLLPSGWAVGPWTTVIASLADSTSRPLAVDLPGGRMQAFRWASDGLSVLYTRTNAATDSFLIRNLTTGAERHRYTAGWEGSLGGVALSPDGRRLAFVVTACRTYGFFTPCYPYSGLFTVNLTQLGGDQGSGSLTASGPDGSIDAPVFTPDATHVVYVYDGTLRVSVVP